MGLIRFVIIWAVILTVIYFSISLYSRSVRREKLEDEWNAKNPGGDRADHDAFVEAGMVEYEQGFRKRLIWLVYIIPTLIAATTLYIVNN